MKKSSTKKMIFYRYKMKRHPMKKLFLISALLAILATQHVIHCSQITKDDEIRFQTITREHEDEIFEFLLAQELENNLELGLADETKSLSENFKDSLAFPKDSWEHINERQMKLMVNCLAKEKYWRKKHQSCYPNNPLPDLLANQ